MGTSINAATFVRQLSGDWCEKHQSTVSLEDVRSVTDCDTMQLEWAAEALSMMKKPKPLLERWHLNWRPVADFPKIDPVAAAAEDSDTDPDAVRRAITQHVKAAALAKKAAINVDVAEAPTAASAILSAFRIAGMCPTQAGCVQLVCATGTNKQPVIDFSGEQFLTGLGDDRSWLVTLLEGASEATSIPAVSLSIADVNAEHLTLTKKVAEVEKQVEVAARGIKGSAWETVDTMMDYMSSQPWWDHGPGSDFVHQLEALEIRNAQREDFVEVWSQFAGQMDGEAKRSIKDGTGSKGELRIKAEVAKASKCRAFMAAFCERRREPMEALAAMAEAAELRIRAWSGVGDSMNKGQPEVEAHLRDRWTAALSGLQGVLTKDQDETARIVSAWTENTSSDSYLEAASNKDLQARLRKLDHRAERAVSECTAALREALSLTGKERALSNLSAAAVTALQDEHSATRPVLQRHQENQQAVEAVWEVAKGRYLCGVEVGIALLERAVGVVLQPALTAAFKEWGEEVQEQQTQQAEAEKRRAVIAKEKSHEQSEKAKKEQEQGKLRKEAQLKREREQAQKLEEVKQEGARLAKEKEDQEGARRVEEEAAKACEAKQKKEEAKRRKKEEAQRIKREGEEAALAKLAAAEEQRQAQGEQQSLPLPKPLPPADRVPTSPAAESPPSSPPGSPKVGYAAAAVAGAATAAVERELQKVVQERTALQLYVQRLEQELLNSRQNIEALQQKNAAQEESLKQVRKERDQAVFSLRKYEDAQVEAKPSSKARAKTPTRKKERSRRDEDTEQVSRDGWTTQPRKGPAKPLPPPSPEEKKPTAGVFEVLSESSSHVTFGPVASGGDGAQRQKLNLKSRRASQVDGEGVHPTVAKGPSVGKGFMLRRRTASGAAGPPVHQGRAAAVVAGQPAAPALAAPPGFGD